MRKSGVNDLRFSVDDEEKQCWNGAFHHYHHHHRCRYNIMHNGGFFVLPTIIIHSLIVLLVSIMVGRQ